MAEGHHYSIFKISEPGQITLDIIGFGNIIDAVAEHALQSIFIHIEGEIRFVVGFKIALRSHLFR